jgi:hypothetical protein
MEPSNILLKELLIGFIGLPLLTPHLLPYTAEPTALVSGVRDPSMNEATSQPPEQRSEVAL